MTDIKANNLYIKDQQRHQQQISSTMALTKPLQLTEVKAQNNNAENIISWVSIIFILAFLIHSELR